MELCLLICNKSKESLTARAVAHLLRSTVVVNTNAKAPEELSDLTVDLSGNLPEEISSFVEFSTKQENSSAPGPSLQKLTQFVTELLASKGSGDLVLGRISELLQLVPIRPLLLVLKVSESEVPKGVELNSDKFVTSNHIFGLKAILRYLVNSTSGSKAQEHLHYINWASEFAQLTSCVGKKEIEEALSELDAKVNVHDFLVNDKLSVADLVVLHSV
ncbi:hypothetical protein BEWA_047970 [Theileria equi strain WA]|uniref:Uncharacterized protein n=1 Tax=Theileria equi strain WA TaxID=1537102 RepID=L1LAM7_THEEQ|nr:hypothetical protein BEWA_047970 [Theileria equi strain WA]EKX72330.1 hypothetical protein BEWA_047970 [Theileria equi strain WA]|eukprot:XP_004831782.1 hypothetical protein BEWA_047970 [Theileria equi strain WA]